MHDVSILAERAHAIIFKGASPKDGVRIQKSSSGLRFLVAQQFKFMEQNKAKEYFRKGRVNWARMAREGHTVLQVMADGNRFGYVGVVIDGSYFGYPDADRVPAFDPYRD